MMFFLVYAFIHHSYARMKVPIYIIFLFFAQININYAGTPSDTAACLADLTEEHQQNYSPGGKYYFQNRAPYVFGNITYDVVVSGPTYIFMYTPLTTTNSISLERVTTVLVNACISYYLSCNSPNVQDLQTGACNNPKNAGQPNPATCNGNPCDAASGNKFQTEIDYQSNSIHFVRYYNSLYETQSVLGRQWTHDYLASLTIGDTIKVNRPDGKVLDFQNEAGNWVSDADITETLTPVGSLWEYKTSNDSIETYNAVGQLLSMTTRDGKTTNYTYNANNLLEQVTGPYGRTLGFAYDSLNRLSTLTTPDNTQIHYGYDDVTNNLTSVTYPDDTPSDLSDNPQKIYHYEDVTFPHHLTGITDENGKRYATWAYNENGLAILSEHANSAEKVALVYNADETTSVTDVLGRVKTYTFESHYGLRKPKTIQYSYNDGQQAVTKTKTYTYYPENGQVQDITDYNGNITYFEYNDRGLITLETQAQGTPEAYTVTTTWHPDFRLPATRTYPDRTETYSYDSNGQLTNTQITTNP